MKRMGISESKQGVKNKKSVVQLKFESFRVVPILFLRRFNVFGTINQNFFCKPNECNSPSSLFVSLLDQMTKKSKPTQESMSPPKISFYQLVIDRRLSFLNGRLKQFFDNRPYVSLYKKVKRCQQTQAPLNPPPPFPTYQTGFPFYLES